MKNSNTDISFQLSNQRNQLILGLTLVLLFGAIGGVLMNRQTRTYKVLVAARDIPSGVRLVNQDIRTLEISGAYLRNAITELPKSAISTHAIKSGDVISSNHLAGVIESAAVVSFEFPQVDLPVGLRVGDLVQLWQVVPAESAQEISTAEVLEIADTRYDQNKKVSFRVQPGLISAVLIAGSELKIVRIT